MMRDRMSIPTQGCWTFEDDISSMLQSKALAPSLPSFVEILGNFGFVLHPRATQIQIRWNLPSLQLSLRSVALMCSHVRKRSGHWQFLFGLNN